MSSRAPHLEALGRIASTVARDTMASYGSLPLGLTADDLLAEGWLAWATHVRRYPRVPRARLYARARYAMIDLLRGALSPVSGSLGRQGAALVAVSVSEVIPASRSESDGASPARRLRLRRADIRAFRAFCGRRLSARSARLMTALCLEGLSLGEMAAALGITDQQASVARSQAVAALLAACASSRPTAPRIS